MSIPPSPGGSDSREFTWKLEIASMFPSNKVSITRTDKETNHSARVSAGNPFIAAAH